VTDCALPLTRVEAEATTGTTNAIAKAAEPHARIRWRVSSEIAQTIRLFILQFLDAATVYVSGISPNQREDDVTRR
jgi:hypothetical protein